MKIEVRVVVTRDDGPHVGDYTTLVLQPTSPIETMLVIGDVAGTVANGLDFLINHDCDKPREKRDGMVGRYDHRN